MKVSPMQLEFSRQLLLELEQGGVSSSKLMDELRHRGVHPSETPNALLGEEAMVLLESAAELADDPCLALRLGQRMDIASFGIFGFALMSCANLRDSIRLLLRYGQLSFEPIWKVYEYEGGLLLRVNPKLATARRRQLVMELSLSNLTVVGRSLCGKKLTRAEGVEVHFSYPRPAHSACYRRCFDFPATFNCEHSQLFIPAHVFDTPVKTANRAEHVVFHQQCEEMLRGLSIVEKTTTAVRQLLIQSAGDFLDITQVADALHMSERTLRRRLKAESTSFRSVVEEVKGLLAREYLRATELTVAEIAQLLGYSETANFRRAFMAWTGVTPSEYRQQ